jgi:hypothetical protein
MLARVKIFPESSPCKLEKKINDWLTKSNANIVKVFQTESSSDEDGPIVTITIFYQ